MFIGDRRPRRSPLFSTNAALQSSRGDDTHRACSRKISKRLQAKTGAALAAPVLLVKHQIAFFGGEKPWHLQISMLKRFRYGTTLWLVGAFLLRFQMYKSFCCCLYVDVKINFVHFGRRRWLRF